MASALFDVAQVVVRLEQGRHAHESAHRAAIAADWATRRAANPRLFNGPTVLGARWACVDDRLTIACRAIDYATLLHWLATPGGGAADASAQAGAAVHVFTNAVMTGSDGRIVMGRMAAHTYNAGRVYMPSGSFDLLDFTGGLASLESNMRREVREETGLDLGAGHAMPGYRVVAGRGLMAIFRVYRFDEPGEALARRARDWLAKGGDGELAEILTMAPGETDPAMPDHVRRFMTAHAG